MFKELISLKYLHSSKEIFYGLSNLTNLSLSCNQISYIQNETFVYLISLKNLTINKNQIKFIDLNGFKGIEKLIYLNLNNNSLDTSQVNNQSFLLKLSSLIQLEFAFNQISSITKYDLIGLNRLEILNLKSNQTFQIEANSFDSFDSRLRRLYLSMANISNENIYNIKNSLRPKIVKKYYRWQYILPTHIENRIDIDCSKTLFFMRSYLLYNFLNEYIDIEDFFTNCMNLTKLRNDLNKLEESFKHKNSIEIESHSKLLSRESGLKIYAYYILGCVCVSLIYFVSKYLIKYKIKSVASQRQALENNFIEFGVKHINQEIMQICFESEELDKKSKNTIGENKKPLEATINLTLESNK